MAKTTKAASSLPAPPVVVAGVPGLAVAILVSLLAFPVRGLISLGPYSGQATPLKYGDYEAQRHWMEITLHLPAAVWYRNSSTNDFGYWRLDSPRSPPSRAAPTPSSPTPLPPNPLPSPPPAASSSPPPSDAMDGAVVGFDCSSQPRSTSCGRTHVLVSDAVVIAIAHLCPVMWLLTMIFLNPCSILLDHGHFQENHLAPFSCGIPPLPSECTHDAEINTCRDLCFREFIQKP